MYRLAKAREQKACKLDQVKCIKREDGRVLVEDAHIKRRRKKVEEVIEATRRIRRDRAAGPDEIPVDFWKYTGGAALAQDSHHVDIPPQELGGSQLALETSVTSINDLEKEMGKIDSKMVAIEHKAEDAITSMGNRIGFLLSYTGAWVFYQDLKLPCKVIWWIAFVSVVYMIGGLCLAIYGAARELKKMTTSVEKLDQERGKQVEKAKEIINSETSRSDKESRSDQENQNANVDDISQLHPTEKSDSVMKRSELIKNSEKYLTRFKAYYWLYVCAAILCVVLNVACICCISYFTYCHAGISVGDSVPEASLANINSSELPPHLVLDMPALSPTMIEVGDILHEIETDKATTDFESLEKGRLLAEILSPEGSKDVTVGQPIAITVEDENDVEAVRILSSSNNVVKEEKPVIAARTLESKQSTPPLYLSTEKYDVKVSVNDIVIKVVATASRNVPEANAYWDNGKGEVVLCNSVNISAAVATEKGLMTPIIRNPDKKSISSISAEVNMDIG
ncbi:hypothetical protein CQW23_27733 [Capsicum baccatum]|uniref:Dihydrolipoamide acetyltransferase component of pyruvate dehydrogenase complex n=1 Tax=Capsicum baccatum TaxID=33114 RepID=A0A2G2VEK8_CAPBA|nr:hypothetical protein CQW23_27733 [Capsicum baccatum]